MTIFYDLLVQVNQLHLQSESHSNSGVSFLYSLHQTDTHTNSAVHRQDSLIKSLSQFEKVYTSRLCARNSESINQLFSTPGRSLPKEEEVMSIVKTFSR